MSLRSFAITIVLFFSTALYAQPVDLCGIVPKVLNETAELRKLQVIKPVPCLVHGKEQVRKYLHSQIETELKPGQLKYEEIFFKTIGFFPVEKNYKTTLVELYVSQLGGYYDPKKDRFIMASWMPADFQAPIAVHELTHALQDQHFNLEEVIKIKRDSSDLQLARAALVEGDASALMLDFSLKQSGSEAIENMNSTQIQSYSAEMIDSMQSVTGKTHGGLDRLLVFPYSAGLNFVHKLLKTEGYAAVNSAYKRLPRSTEEVLHFDKYLEEDPSFTIISEADVMTGISNKDSEILYSDSYGEYFLRVWLSILGVSEESAELASAGWGGDRVVVLKTKGRGRVRWKISWDSSRDADQFFGVVSPALQKLSLSNPDSKVKLKRSGLDILLVAEF